MEEYISVCAHWPILKPTMSEPEKLPINGSSVEQVISSIDISYIIKKNKNNYKNDDFLFYHDLNSFKCFRSLFSFWIFFKKKLEILTNNNLFVLDFNF